MARLFSRLALLCLCFGSTILSAASVVLLPLIPANNQNKHIWIGESVPETVSEILSSYGIFILSREDRLQAYRTLSIADSGSRTLATNLRVAMELDADYAVFGRVDLTEAEDIPSSPLVLTVQVTDVRNWRKRGEIRVEGKLSELGVLESRLAYLLLRALQPEKAGTEEEFLQRHPPVRLDALESYVRGLLADTEEAKHRLFTQAARLEESYAPPAFQLAMLYWAKENHRQAANWLRRLQPQFSQYREAQFMLGVCEFRLGQYAEAEDHFRQLYAEVPLAEVANNLGVAMARQAKPDAMDFLLKAIQADPDDPDYRFNLGHLLWMRERYDDAAERFREVLDLAGEDTEATKMLGRSLQKEASRPAKAAVENLNRLKDTFDEAEFEGLLASRDRTTPAPPPARP